MFYLHGVIGCLCAVKRDCMYLVLTPLSINYSVQVKIDILLKTLSQIPETKYKGNEDNS